MARPAPLTQRLSIELLEKGVPMREPGGGGSRADLTSTGATILGVGNFTRKASVMALWSTTVCAWACRSAERHVLQHLYCAAISPFSTRRASGGVAPSVSRLSATVTACPFWLAKAPLAVSNRQAAPLICIRSSIGMCEAGSTR